MSKAQIITACITAALNIAIAILNAVGLGKVSDVILTITPEINIIMVGIMALFGYTAYLKTKSAG